MLKRFDKSQLRWMAFFLIGSFVPVFLLLMRSGSRGPDEQLVPLTSAPPSVSASVSASASASSSVHP